jgi:hypothetical protein
MLVRQDDPSKVQWQWCRCVKCGIVAICRPDFDFYARKAGDPHQCETCFKADLQRRYPGTVGFGPSRGRA